MRYDHALLAGCYANLHRDPFDRMLAAQSEIEKMPLLALDTQLKKFANKTIW